MLRNHLRVSLFSIILLGHLPFSLAAAETSEAWVSHRIDGQPGDLLRLSVGSWFEEGQTQLIITSREPNQALVYLSPAGEEKSGPWNKVSLPAEDGVAGIGVIPLNNSTQNVILIGNYMNGFGLTFTPSRVTRDLLGRGNLQSTRFTLPHVQGMACMTVDDIDGDGTVELVVGGSGWSVEAVPKTEVYVVKPGAAFWLPSQWDAYKIGDNVGVKRILTRDMNDDGHRDVLIYGVSLKYGASDSDKTVTWLENPGKGFGSPGDTPELWTKHTITAPEGWLTYMAVCDVEHPSYPSPIGFVTSHLNGQVTYFYRTEGKWEGRVFATLKYFSSNGGNGVRIGDMTGDDQPDLILNCRNRTVTPEDGVIIHTPMLRDDGTDITPENSTLIAKIKGGHVPEFFEPIDIDNDGDLDVVYGYRNAPKEFTLMWAENPLVP